MLKQRIVTAVILIPIFLLLVFFLPPVGFCLFTGAIIILAAYEWSNLMGLSHAPRALIFPAILILFLIASLAMYIPYVVYFAVLWWILATLLILLYPKSSTRWGQSVLVKGIMGVLVLMPSWVAINFIREQNGIEAVLFLFVLIWVADSAAYFTGKKWGKHKLAPLISPGKTWQGVIGALVATIIVTILALSLMKVSYPIWPGAIIVSLITVIFSIIGDLFESMLKRKANIKDSGNLIPGHGGILDRIDSLTAAAPIFLLGTMILGKIYH